MIESSQAAVRAVLVEFLTSQVATGVGEHMDLRDDLDLLSTGMIDSLGFLALMTVMHDAFGQHIDFEALDPDEMGLVGPFCAFVAQQAQAA